MLQRGQHVTARATCYGLRPEQFFSQTAGLADDGRSDDVLMRKCDSLSKADVQRKGSSMYRSRTTYGSVKTRLDH